MANRVAIVGSRGYPNEWEVRDYVRLLPADATVISGGANGPDSWAEDEARKRGLKVVVHRPDWDTHGKIAGFIRNSTIINDCDRMIAFWDGRSRGTMDSIRKCQEAGKSFHVKIPSGIGSA